MKCDCANCTTHACYTKGVNCTGVDPLEVLDAYTDQEKEIMQAAAAARPWRCHRPCSTASAPPPASAMSSRFINQIGLEPLFRKRKELSNDEN